jgi:hypothetical protein
MELFARPQLKGLRTVAPVKNVGKSVIIGGFEHWLHSGFRFGTLTMCL